MRPKARSISPDVGPFALVSVAGARGALVVERLPEATDDIPLLLGETVPSTPVPFRQAEGAGAWDMVATSGGAVLVSQRLVEALTQCGATGWSTYEVELSGRDGSPMGDLAGLTVAGRCGPLDDSRLPRRWTEPPLPGGMETLVWVGFDFPRESWDGSDLFIPEGTTLIFATDDVGQALSRCRLRNVEVRRFDEVERISATVDGKLCFAPTRAHGAPS